MKRKMVFVGISYAIGLFCASFYNMAFFLCMAVFGLIVGAVMIKRQKYAQFLCCMISFAVGFSYYLLYDSFKLKPLEALNNQTCTIEGEVADISYKSDDNCVLTVKGSVNGKKTTVLVYGDAVNASLGDKITAVGKVNAFENTYLYNTKDYYKSNGIMLVMYNPESVYVYEGEFSLLNVISEYVDDVEQYIRRQLPEFEGEMLCAMLFGDKSGMASSEKEVFYKSGIGHIMATSGLHLVIIVWLIMLVFAPIFKEHIVARSLFAMLVGFVFVVCASFSPSVVRAYIMLIISHSAPLFFKKSDTLNSLCVAVVAMTLFTPYVIRNASFVLSVFGVLSTAVFAPYFTAKVKRPVLKAIANAVCISICIVPASVLYFDEISIISPVSNLLLVPLCTVALCATAIAFIFSQIGAVAQLALMVGGFCCKIVYFCVRFLSSLSFSSVYVVQIGVSISIWLMFAFLLLYFYISPKKVNRFIPLCSCLVCFAIVNGFASYLNSTEDKIAVYSDRGGTVAVCINDNGVTVIDSGALHATEFADVFLSQYCIGGIDKVYMLCDENANISKWHGFSQIYNIDEYVFSSDGFDDGQIRIFEKDYYCFEYDDISLCVADCDVNTGVVYDYVYNIANVCSVNAENGLFSDDITAFCLRYNEKDIKLEILEHNGD